MIRVLMAALFAVSLVVTAAAQDSVANLTDECVAEYDPSVDYFPDKIEVADAEGFSVEYFNNYKQVSVTGGFEPYEYILVQCGTPLPEADAIPEGAQVIEVPAGNIIALSTTFLPGIAELGLADNVVGLDSLLFASTPEIVERIEAGEIAEVSPNFELNTELVLDAEPSMVMSNDFDSAGIAQLIDAGVVTAVNTDYAEGSPLGQAEWLKYTALFYNQEAEAEALYDEIVTEYEAVVDLAADVAEDERPTVLWNTPFNGDWAIPGGLTFSGQLLEAAGANVALSAPDGASAQIFSVETVYDGALDADVWIALVFAAGTLDDFVAQDPRYADFAAVQNGEVWNNDLDVNENGGNNYFELGVIAPHLVLQDLVAIFHPELLPDHEFTFFRRLEAAES